MKGIIAAIFSAFSMVFADAGISDFQWKNRLLIFQKATKELVIKLDSEKAGLHDRDLRVFVLGGEGKADYPAEPKLAAEFVKRLSPHPENPKVYLIGKDGRTILEWTAENFSFKKLYASIDAMPMRQREMREDR